MNKEDLYLTIPLRIFLLAAVAYTATCIGPCLENKNPNRPKGRGIFNIENTKAYRNGFASPTTASSGVSSINNNRKELSDKLKEGNTTNHELQKINDYSSYLKH